MAKSAQVLRPTPLQQGSITEPTAGLPRMAPEFGLKPRKKYLPWSHACAQLEKACNYWIITVRPDGRPHAMPVWGFWVNDALYFGTARDSRKWHNLASNPHVIVHLESAAEVVVVEGVASEITNRALIAALRPVSEKKYGMWMPPDPRKHVVIAVRPQTAFAWSEKDIPGTATRWLFED